MVRKIVYVTGSRAEYGVMRSTLKALSRHKKLSLSLIITGMHFSDEFGRSIKEIEKDNFYIAAKIPILNDEDTGASMAKAFGKQMIAFVEVFEKIKPDILLVEGDRGEMLAATIASAYMNIPVAHVSGGDIRGGFDESIRHAITKIAHIHFPGTKQSAERIIKMGEETWRVDMVGTPGLDIPVIKPTDKVKIAKKYKLDLTKPILLVIQHPVTTESKVAGDQIKETLNAIVELKHQTILIYPNADAGGREMIKVIKKYEKYSFIKTFKNIPRREYLILMSIASVMAGNSSSAIVEAPCFGLCAINIGTRQRGREKANNIVDIGYDRKEIVRAVKSLLAKKNANIKRFKSPYKGINTEKKIVDLLCKLRITPRMLEKKIVFG